jgi:hypothetical protein
MASIMTTTTTLRFILTQLEMASMTMTTMKIGRIQVETVLMTLTGTAAAIMVRMRATEEMMQMVSKKNISIHKSSKSNAA